MSDTCEEVPSSDSFSGSMKYEPGGVDDDDCCRDSVASGDQPTKKKWTRVGVPKFRCLVCGDGAYGNNFGLVTCESCKAFFRRQINRPQPFPCTGNSNCVITSTTRKRCPACRLRKCYEVGMQPDIGEARRKRRRENERARQAARRNRLALLASSSRPESEVEEVKVVPQTPMPLAVPVSHAVWMPKPLPMETFSRLKNVSESLIKLLEAPFEESELAVLFTNHNLFSSALPQTFTELQNIREATIRRFIRFAKSMDEFREHFAFGERVAVLKRTLLACYVLHFGLGWDVQRGKRRVRLINGHEETITHQFVCLLKRKSGMDENDSNHADYVALHGAIRERFPLCWPVVIAALSVATLFSPDVSNGTLDLDCLDEYDYVPDCSVPLCERLAAVRRLYIRFIIDYAAQVEYVTRGRCFSPEERINLGFFCREQMAYAYLIGENVAERLSTAVRLDPMTAMKIMPLLVELKSC